MSVVIQDSLRDILEPVESITPHPDNPRRGDIPTLVESIRRNGLYRPVYVQRSTRFILAGNHTFAALKELGASEVPVVWLDVDDTAAQRILLVDNRSADLGWYDEDLLLDILKNLDGVNELIGTGYSKDDLDHLVMTVNEVLHQDERDAEHSHGRGAHVGMRTVPLRLVFSVSAGPGSIESLLALRAGWKLGLISSAVGRARLAMQRFPKQLDGKVVFMDNEWTEYDHAAHYAAIREIRPESATTRDLLTKEQAKQAGVRWQSIEETLAQAEQIAEHVDDVILIPKFDCLDRLPDTLGSARVVLGYSVQSSYGATPLPIAAFAGRPIHLLGGSWARQRSLLIVAGDDVVGLDNNNILKLARVGTYAHMDGGQGQVNDVVPPTLFSYIISFVLSLTNIATAIVQDFGETIEQFEVEWDDLPEPQEVER